MPYFTSKTNETWRVINSETGEIKGTHKDESTATANARLLNMIQTYRRPICESNPKTPISRQK